jgi:hypothetical protein
MLRDKLMAHHDPVDGFRWRSHEITRIEGFSDAVFGFALTLLIVSLEVPKTSTELLETMRGFGAFVVTFLILARLWYAQYTFFRRYGLEDRVTVTLNLVLLFTVLFFVYPMKFLFTNMLENPFLKGTIRTPRGIERVVLPEHRPLIFLIFGAGFAAVFAVFFLLYRRAYEQREALKLNEFEIFETQHSIRRFGVATLVGLAYLPTAWLQSLPSRTPGEKRLVVVVGVAVLLAFMALLISMARMTRTRRRRRAEWKARQGAEEPHLPVDDR